MTLPCPTGKEEGLRKSGRPKERWVTFRKFRWHTPQPRWITFSGKDQDNPDVLNFTREISLPLGSIRYHKGTNGIMKNQSEM